MTSQRWPSESTPWPGRLDAFLETYETMYNKTADKFGLRKVQISAGAAATVPVPPGTIG